MQPPFCDIRPLVLLPKKENSRRVRWCLCLLNLALLLVSSPLLAAAQSVHADGISTVGGCTMSGFPGAGAPATLSETRNHAGAVIKPGPLQAGSKHKPSLAGQSLKALHALRFEPTEDGSGMVSRSGQRSLRIATGGSVEIDSYVSRQPAQVVLRLDGSNSQSPVTGVQALPGRSNYFLGNDPAKWRSGVAQFEQACVNAVYPGIDLLYYGNGESLEHDYQVAPNADPGLIRMRIGGSFARIDAASGNLVVSQLGSSTELLRLHRPVAYQAKPDGSHLPVTAAYAANRDGSFGFVLGDYDRSRPLVIDPVITYSTYFGGSNDDGINDLKLDAAGNIYLLLQTSSVDLPVLSQISGACVGMCGPANPSETAPRPTYDMYLAKLDPTGQTLLYSTYIGGGQNDVPGGLAIAGDGTIYISGATISPDFPVVNQYSNALAPLDDYGDQPTTNTLTRLSADGSQILYSTTIGGGFKFVLSAGTLDQTNFSQGNVIETALNTLAVAPNGIAYVMGEADTPSEQSGNFIDAKNTTFVTGLGSFIAKFDTTKSGADSLIYARPFGAPGDFEGESFSAIALDSNENLWVAGLAGDGGTPPTPTPDAVQPICGGSCTNAFLFELSPAGDITYATYLGGTMSSDGGPTLETVSSMYIDSSDNIYLAGHTYAVDFPTKNAAYTYATFNENSNFAFLTKLSPGAQSILYSTYLPQIWPLLSVTSDGIVATASSEPASRPIFNGIPFQSANGGDAYVELFDTTKSGADSLLSSGYLGSGGSIVQGATFDAQQNLVIAGVTSATLPVVDPYQSTCSGGCMISPQGYPENDGFVSVLDYELSLTPTSEIFANTNVGATSAALTATLTNSSVQTVTLSTPSLTDSADFTATDDCNGALAKGASCTITFTFKPGSAGALASTYSIADASHTDRPLTVKLSGVGVEAAAPVPALTPSALDFGSVTVGSTSAAQMATLSNSGTAPLAVSSIALTGANATSFAQTNTCGSTVAASASCTISVTCKPSAAGALTATLAATYPSPLPQQTVTLTCTGAAAAMPAAALAPASLSFTTTAGTAPATQAATLTNKGTAALAISSIAIGGTNASSFAETNNCGGALAAGASCAITISFTETIVGSYTATLTATDNATPAAQTVALTGTVAAAIAPGSPIATLSPASLSFTATAGSASGTQAATLTNTGTAALTITSIVIGGANPAAFTQSNTCGPSIAAGANCAITVSFNGTAAGSYAAMLTVTDNASPTMQTASLTGTITAAAPPSSPLATVAPSAEMYTATTGTTSAAQVATLTNSGTATLHISGITITGANPSEFTISANTCGATLSANASCTIAVDFTPDAAANFTASLSVADDAAGSPQTSALTGTGTAVPVAADFTVAATPASQSVTGGSAATYTVNVTSTGGNFINAVTLTATGLPPGSTVTFSPVSVTPGSSGAQSSMTIQTAVATVSQGQTTRSPFSKAATAPVFAALLLLIPGWRSRRRWNAKPGRAFIAGAGCLLVLVGMSGCGGGFALPQAQPSAVTYTVTVTGTSGSVQHNTTVQITVR